MRERNYTNTSLKRKKVSKKRKMKALRNKIIFMAMASTFMIVIFSSIFSMNAKANSVAGANDYKYFSNYCIEPGDTLWSIAEENFDSNHYDSVKEYAKEIQKINKINSDHITNGTYIMIPYYDSELK